LPRIAAFTLFILGCASPHAAVQRPNLILEGAKRQLQTPAIYTPGYFKIAYPGGDLPANKGVCTDVVIRALRHAGTDLQKAIHTDMAKRTYPRREKKRDSNIDHRRVPNQMFWLDRFATKLPLDRDWKPGDLVYWKLNNGLDHCGIVSDRLNDRRQPYVIHNIWQTAEEDVLTEWKIVGHYRLKRAG
jgi:uncharacterized protein YijF (DUF1287 family)